MCTKIKFKENFKEVNQVENDCCPICGKKFTMLTNLIKIGNIAYHLECVDKTDLLKNISK